MRFLFFDVEPYVYSLILWGLFAFIAVFCVIALLAKWKKPEKNGGDET